MNYTVCRTCLQPSNESIFQQINVGVSHISLIDMIKLCIGLEVTESDQISLNICNNCTSNIIKIYLFRQTCWNSQSYLLNELQNKLDEKPANDPCEVKCDNKNVQSLIISEENKMEKTVNLLEQNDDAEESPPSNLDKFIKITFREQQALSIYCEFIKKSPKRGSNGAWKCRKCGNITIRTLRMLHHLVRAHNIKVKISKTNSAWKFPDPVIDKYNGNLTDVHTKQQALSTFTFYPNIDQVDQSLPRTTQQCRECGYTNIVPNQMIYHLRKSHNIKIVDRGEFKCAQCEVKCRSYYFLVMHEKTHDESNEQNVISGISRRTFKCTKCDQKFETQFNFERHKRIHVRKPNAILPKRKAWVRKCICEHCGETFATPYSLREHVRTHTGEKPYKCKICDYRSSHYSSITSHMRMHSGLRPYKCDICGSSYVSLCALTRHGLVHSNDKPFECSICLKKYKYDSTYRIHLKSHDPDTYLACEFCDRKCATKKTLNLHRKQHTGEKPHACELCDKRFIQRKSWRLHMKNHHEKTLN